MLFKKLKIVIIGGGAAGFFAAIRAAELSKSIKSPVDVVLLEASSSFLKKVRISGGGRCNVTHNCFDIQQFCQNYPRGEKQLYSPMSVFQASDTVEWFRNHGVKLVAEPDGRMFPDTNSSETIIECYNQSAKRSGVQLLTNHPVERVKKSPTGEFSIFIKNKETIVADKILIATGSSPFGYRLAKNLGHSITDLAPSLFSFKINDPLLKPLPGLSFSNAAVKLTVKLTVEGSKVFKQQGPLLITHWGLSGPAILKLSAWAAREMKASKYKAQLTVNWLGAESRQELVDLIESLKLTHPKSYISNVAPKGITKRFWAQLLSVSLIKPELRVSELSRKHLNLIVNRLYEAQFDVVGKNRFKEEFVECGGVNLKEINFKSMQSKICEGLYFAGELLDVDGVTGGFNFQNAWSTAWVAATDMVSSTKV